jgi:MFS family permease
MSTDKNIKLINYYTMCMSAMFLIAVIVPFYRDQMGLSFHDFLIGEACFAATLVLLEVPSGWLSDVWQRKHVLALGALFELIGWAMLTVADNLAWAIAAQVVIGVAISLISGTNTAFLYDTLLSAKRTDEFRAAEGKRSGLGYYTIAAASVVSGLLYSLHHMLPVLVTVAFVLAALVFACLMDEPVRHKKMPEKNPLADMAETCRYALHGHGDVGMIILFAAVMFCATKMIMWSQQPYYMAMGLKEEMFGLLIAAGFLLAGFSSHIGHLFDGRIGSLRALAGVWVIAVLVCLGASAHLGWAGIVLMMIGGTCLYGIGQPRVSEAINKRVTSERRATILSTQNLMVSLFFIPVSSAIGWIVDRHGVQGGLIGIAGWLSLAGFCLLLIFVFSKGARSRMMLM